MTFVEVIGAAGPSGRIRCNGWPPGYVRAANGYLYREESTDPVTLRIDDILGNDWVLFDTAESRGLVVGKESVVRRIARVAAAALFVDGDDRLASRLALMYANVDGREYQGVGYGFESAVDVIERALLAESGGNDGL